MTDLKRKQNIHNLEEKVKQLTRCVKAILINKTEILIVDQQ